MVYDALANPTLLNEAPANAERIDAGKRARAHRLTQDQTNALLAEKALQGRFVVRLKGGDPYLFGRGAEEAIYLAQRGIACEIVPGVTAGIAAPAMAGIPVTHRVMASSVTFVTGHEDPTKPETAIDYRALASMIIAGGTLCIYMGVGRLEHIAEALQREGVAADVPAALVQWGTLPSQRSARATIATLAAEAASRQLGAPAIIVIGAVAGVNDPALNGFTSRPLFGQRIVVTRTRQQSSRLRDMLEACGADVLEAPTIEIHQPDDWAEVDAAIARLTGNNNNNNNNSGDYASARYDWLVLTSANGVAALADRMNHAGRDARALAGVNIAAIGDATEAALYDGLRLRPDFVPSRAVGESLAGELLARESLADKRVLILRADIARPVLPTLLRDAGAVVDELDAYITRPVASLPQNVLDAFASRTVDWVTFTSSSTATNLVNLLNGAASLASNAAGTSQPSEETESAASVLAGVKLASIGPITTKTMTQLGLTPAIEAEDANVAGLVDAIVRAMRDA